MVSQRALCSLDQSNILPEGARRLRKPVGERLINRYIRKNSALFLEDIDVDELEAAIIESVSGDEAPKDEDPDYVEYGK
eukprot:scaffold47679_cov40-Tisochrysis_lutea.AAC.1